MNTTNDTKLDYKTVAIVVTYASRTELVKQTIEHILHDPHVIKLIIIDNASYDKEALEKELQPYGSRIHLIRHEKNLGSAGGFARGIEEARKEDANYIYLSDDDIIVSDNFVSAFARAHRIIGNPNTVLCARRASYWAGTDVHYAPDTIIRPRRYFNIFNPRIFIVFLKTLLRIKDTHPAREPSRFLPIITSRGWAYAGVYLPIEAARQAPLPDVTLGLYLDDIVYSWGVIDSGYRSFALTEPHLTDLELTHSDSQTASSLFADNVSSTKIYYETRNRVRVSIKYGKALPYILVWKVMLWYLGVCGLGLLRTGFTRNSLERAALIIEALRAGFDINRAILDTLHVKI